jgi:putative toxin-antitoxin system antitoxin component (TIGR02293 family)
MAKTIDLLPENITYELVDDQEALYLVDAVRQGIKFGVFMNIAGRSPFNLNEWSHFLHLSERTMQRYKRDKLTFSPLQSEKIIQITLLYEKGIEVFGNKEKFNAWLNTENLALGKIKPKELLDSAFGINLLKDELVRIEHGILA